jgi:hypothetical protein
MTYSFVSYSATQIKVTEDTREYIYKKVYCTTSVDGDYFIFSTHNAETGLMMQQYKLLYSDCALPSTASADALKDAVDAIINSYAGGGGGGAVITTTITVTTPKKEFSATVTDTSATALSKVMATHSPTAQTQANFGSAIFIYSVPASGSILFTLVAPQNDLLYGDYIINYTIST